VRTVSQAALLHAHEHPALWHESLCPRATCGALLVAPLAVQQRAPVLACLGCSHRVCTLCGFAVSDGMHEGRSCDQARAARERVAAVAIDAGALVGSKPCPNCRVPEFKDDECMHVTCDHCGALWNWCCATLGQEGHPPYECPRGGIVPENAEALGRERVGVALIPDRDQ
jgi:hypothetical protein